MRERETFRRFAVCDLIRALDLLVGWLGVIAVIIIPSLRKLTTSNNERTGRLIIKRKACFLVFCPFAGRTHPTPSTQHRPTTVQATTWTLECPHTSLTLSLMSDVCLPVRSRRTHTPYPGNSQRHPTCQMIFNQHRPTYD